MATKVLVIDDEEAIGASLALMLRRRGYVVLLATDGEQGFALFQAERPDLVITDMIMYGAQGFDTVGRIKAVAPDVPVIAMSGSGIGNAEGVLARATAAGADHCLEKPFEPGEFFSVVTRLLGDKA